MARKSWKVLWKKQTLMLQMIYGIALTLMRISWPIDSLQRVGNYFSNFLEYTEKFSKARLLFFCIHQETIHHWRDFLIALSFYITRDPLSSFNTTLNACWYLFRFACAFLLFESWNELVRRYELIKNRLKEGSSTYNSGSENMKTNNKLFKDSPGKLIVKFEIPQKWFWFNYLHIYPIP